MRNISKISELAGAWMAIDTAKEGMLSETLNELDRLISKFGDRKIPDTYSLRLLSVLTNTLDAVNNERTLSSEDVEKLYCCVYSLTFNVAFEHPETESFDSKFLELRELLSPGNSLGLLKGEVSFVSNVFNNAKVKSDFETLYRYMNEISKYDARISQLSQAEARAKALGEQLDRQEIAFNFVGLYKAFHKLWLQKRLEVKSQKKWLLLLGGSTIVPLVIKLGYSLINPNSELNIPLLVTIGALELILIYFFRIALHSFNSIKAQLLQIELRRALCQFIQKYAEYSQTLKKDNPNALEKFESLIFSGLVMQDDKLPSTFDGLEPIQKIFAGRAGKAGGTI